ncbi:hypothetical protein ISN44_As05g058450 [Arabidopsis suecica]|uniref:Plant thionin family protein n=1 Tax=Arabidopsis suecica TaxID=45249 RepID=A0A8T2DWQ3_ARASU|nr:hypothetical protein ISN44_As05g058450 [Arabidopsis suecica]
MESKWSLVMMVYLVFVMMAAIGGEAQDLSCETKCAITCKDSMFPKKCSSKCLDSCRRHYPPTQLHTRMMAAAIGGEVKSVGCVFKCEFHCKTLIPTTACVKRCYKERCEHHPPTSTLH